MRKIDLVIIGTGPGGFTAAIYAARANLNFLQISGTLPGGLLTQTTEVENFPGFPDGVEGFDLMTRMQKQAEKFGAVIEYDRVSKVDFSRKGEFEIELANGEAIEAACVIVSTGASPRWLGLPSEDRLKNHGVSACATCDGAFYRNQDVVVVGGGDSAMEEAIFLTNFASSVTVVHRRDALRASRIMAERAQANGKIRFIWNSAVAEVLGEKEVEGVLLENLVNGEKQKVACKGVFVAPGHVP
ncbi:MAG: FAD-dependent oxidoreductase, partial [Victivallaceae bacterium]|nr:FAD-dependent oxidoreductase [Victivallaceae bacterium]